VGESSIYGIMVGLGGRPNIILTVAFSITSMHRRANQRVDELHGRSGPWSRRTGAPMAAATRDRHPDAHTIAHGSRHDTPG